MDWQKSPAGHHGQIKMLVPGMDHLWTIRQAGGWRAALWKNMWGTGEEVVCESVVCPCGETEPTALGQVKWLLQ